MLTSFFFIYLYMYVDNIVYGLVLIISFTRHAYVNLPEVQYSLIHINYLKNNEGWIWELGSGVPHLNLM